ncbi:MAG: PA domain-containing protein [Acidobacteriota bacterium]
MRKTTLLSLLALLLAVPAFGAATITIVNMDGPGEGFNDPGPPLLPAAGNDTAASVGEQRLNVFLAAADQWGAILDSDVEIFVRANFDPLFCDATSAVLGSAGALVVQANFDNADFADTWYHAALANRIAGVDLDPPPPEGLQGDDLQARFNSDIDNNPNCLGTNNWYYGLDNNAPANTTDLFQVVKHELGHGLGFANFANEATGALFQNQADIFTQFSRDNTTGLLWSEMNDAERMASAINDQNLVWTGAAVRAEAPNVLVNPAALVITAPGGIAGTYAAQGATYGPAVAVPGTSGSLAIANDGAGADPLDGCEPLAGFPAGNIAIIARGNCAFVTKTQNAQAAGAIGVVVTNNAATGLPPMGGTDPGGITIPSIGISMADGDTIRGVFPVANLGGAPQGSITLDVNSLAGADANGFVKLFAPNPVQPGSSVSHWDTSATPNLLMEPFINPDIGTDVDLTDELFADIGWFGANLPDIIEVPTVDTIGLFGLALLLLAAALWMMSRRRREDV